MRCLERSGGETKISRVMIAAAPNAMMYEVLVVQRGGDPAVFHNLKNTLKNAPRVMHVLQRIIECTGYRFVKHVFDRRNKSIAIHIDGFFETHSLVAAFKTFAVERRIRGRAAVVWADSLEGTTSNSNEVRHLLAAGAYTTSINQRDRSVGLCKRRIWRYDPFAITLVEKSEAFCRRRRFIL